ncbi:MAG: phospholipase D-like domain-containing protein [Candidatus Limnocylindrales bacterium]|nr:phospholipase D-like domain-containing protein [Candidatus Limnocylindrales bacterium]
MYKHVVSSATGSFTARALVGTRSIMLAWDHTGPASERDDLLGFAVHRFDLTADKDTWLQGQTRFAGQENLGPNLTSDIAPFQRFRWGDYGAYPGHRYRYEIHPVRGTAANPTLQTPIKLSLEAAKPLSDGLGVYSNRGVSASLAYRVRFKDPPQDLPEPKRTEAYDWLTRDIKPALLAFIGAAVAGDELRVCIYEFEDDEIRQALLDALGRQVRLRLIYHARAGDAQAVENAANVVPLGAAGAELIPRTNVEKISHNKFIVHLVGGVGAAGAAPIPARVWSGSTNFTRSGLYLQTNLGLVFESPDVASGFARFWEVLAADPAKALAKGQDLALVTSVRTSLPNGPTVYFSPVAGQELLDTAIDLVSNANELVLISSPFGLDVQIRNAINANNPNVIEYGLVNITQKVMVQQLPHAQNKFSWFTTPAWMAEFDGRPWDAKPLGQHKIHTKSIVADPFGQSPRMLVGSANFSDESVNKNDENAFLIEGNQRASAIVATEFLRMFDHYKTRTFIASLQQSPDDQYLAEDGSWSTPYYQSYRLKYRERRVFGGN